jgi:predicted DNA-binding protein YlxM (UPF0122 family)
MELEKNQRINMLFDFYAVLLTQKQMNYIELYYVDDLSLAEIAAEYEVSRQAVYDNIKRTEKVLENFEMKLGLYSNYLMREEIVADLKAKYGEDEFLTGKLDEILELDE